METFKLVDEYVELCNLLKLVGPCLSGGAAKFVISENLVTVDGIIETRKKCKIRSGQLVKYENYKIAVE
ncbi:RNA-binding S4 domain-containing protein [Candidatus Margulisiibacteriota bacterium]